MNNQACTVILSACLGVAAVAITALPAFTAAANDMTGVSTTTPHKHHSRKQPSNNTGNVKSDHDNAMGTTNGHSSDTTGEANTASPTAPVR